jgi:N-acetylmuramoyl-L-alanine amidase
MWSLCLLVCTLMIGCKSTTSSVNPPLGFQARHGDEIVVAGKYYRTGAPVVLWTDPGGYDAYRVERRFSKWEESGWEPTTQAVKDADAVPARYNLRYNRTARERFTPEQLEQIRGGGWDLPLLQKNVDQFVLHYDVCGTSQVCYRVLHDQRFLSVHFMLDIDGTIYQTLDLKERTWHATRSNDRSIGIEIANIGAYAVGATDAPLRQWYDKDASGKTVITIPPHLKGGGVRLPGPFSPRRNDMVVGKIQGTTYRMYDLTPQQYDSLIKLTAALCDIFPEIKPEYPQDTGGNVIPHTLTDDQWRDFKGVLGHYHVQREKQDPGPAMDWPYLMTGVKARLKEIQDAR